MKLKGMIHAKGWLMAVLLLFTSVISFGQSIRFSSFFDSNNGAGLLESVVMMDNGHFMAVGSNLNPANSNRQDGHHVVVDGNGNLVVEHEIVFPGNTFNSQSLTRTTTGGYFTSGYFCDYTVPSPGYCDFYFSRLDESGDTLFTRVINRPDTSDFLLNMVETRPNRIMLIGWTYDDTTNADADLLFITVDTLGNEVNRVVYGGGGTDYIHSGTVINEIGEVILTGYTKSFGGSANGRTWTIKTDSIGNVLWHKVYSGDANNGTGIGICRSSDGNLIISGGNNGSGNGSDGMLLKIDTEGNEIWTKRYQIPNGQGLWGVVGLADGTIVSCGVTDDGNDQAGWLIKTDENGDTLWTRTYDPSDATDYLRNMLVMPNGDIVMVGFGRGENSTTQDGWILRVDSMGCEVENCFLPSVNEELPFGSAQGTFTVYPNPANDVVNFSIQLPVGRSLEVTVTDMLGRQFPLLKGVSRNETGDSVINLNTSALPNGIYLLTITDHNGNSYTERLVVQH